MQARGHTAHAGILGTLDHGAGSGIFREKLDGLIAIVKHNPVAAAIAVTLVVAMASFGAGLPLAIGHAVQSLI